MVRRPTPPLPWKRRRTPATKGQVSVPERPRQGGHIIREQAAGASVSAKAGESLSDRGAHRRPTPGPMSLHGEQGLPQQVPQGGAGGRGRDWPGWHPGELHF